MHINISPEVKVNKVWGLLLPSISNASPSSVVLVLWCLVWIAFFTLLYCCQALI